MLLQNYWISSLSYFRVEPGNEFYDGDKDNDKENDAFLDV